MTSKSITPLAASPILRAAHVYFSATLCLCTGPGIGYLLHSEHLATPVVPNAAPVAVVAGARPAGHHLGLEEMRQMADKQAAPLLEKLKNDPNDVSLLVQVAAIYHTTHCFKEAADYYSRALVYDPKNVALRTKLASSLYRNGDVDGAIAQLNLALKDQPTDPNALFDLGIIKLQGKSDSKGALATWQWLLKTNPDLRADRKATVLKRMADAMTMMGDQHGIEKVRSSNEHD